MIIRVDTIDNMLCDVSRFFNKDPNSLIAEIKEFDFSDYWVSGAQIEEYIRNNKAHDISEVYLCHISRKLKGENIETLYPLPKLLLSENSFSRFLRKYHITFCMRERHIDTYYRGDLVNWGELDRQNGFCPENLTGRMNSDYCINGFCFLPDIRNNMRSDYEIYRKAPELIQQLDKLLYLDMTSEYHKNSDVNCALCRIPLCNATLCGQQEDNEKETEYIYQVLLFLWRYLCKKNGCGNRIIFAPDNCSLHVERWISEEEYDTQINF